MPLTEWPAGGEPNRPDAWHNAPWYHKHSPLVPPPYANDLRTSVDDALEGFRLDLLVPLLRHLASQHPNPSAAGASTSFIDGLPRYYADETLVKPMRIFLTAVRKALIGSRQPKAFAAAAELWHRKAATIAAVRVERMTAQPGWRPLCPPWTLALRHHSFGSFAAEERFGPAIALTGGNTVPTRVVAERHIRRVIGQVPPTSDILRRIRAERWIPNRRCADRRSEQRGEVTQNKRRAPRSQPRGQGAMSEHQELIDEILDITSSIRPSQVLRRIAVAPAHRMI